VNGLTATSAGITVTDVNLNDPGPGSSGRESTWHSIACLAPDRRSGVALVLWVVGLGLVSLVWASASPPGASPDEPAHMIYAWGVASGQGFGEADIPCSEGSGSCPSALYEVPGGLIPRPGCYAFKPATPASCTTTAEAGVHPTAALRYPPLYYAAVGLTMRAVIGAGFDGGAAGYVARLVSAAIAVSLVAPALALASRHARRIVPTIIVVLTPMALFMIGSVNPSGVEISAAISAASAVVVLSVRKTCRPAMLLFAYAVTWLTWSRPLGFIWTGAIFVFGVAYLMFSADRRLSLTAVLRSQSLVVLAAVSNLVGGLGWFVYATGVHRTGALELSVTIPDSGVEEAMALVLRWGEVIRENLGVLGWLDTPMPTPLLLTTAGCIAILAYEPLRASKDDRSRMAVSLVYLVTIFLGITAIMWRQQFLWQGRYVWPSLAAGMVLLAGSAPHSSRRSSRRVAMIAWGSMVAGAFWLYARHVYGLQAGPRHIVPNVSDGAQWLGPLGGPGFVVIGLAAATIVPLVMHYLRVEPCDGDGLTDQHLSPPTARVSRRSR